MSHAKNVLRILHRDGYINNYDVMDGIHGFRTNRLSDVIFRLKNKGLIELDEEKCHMIPNTKNYHYVVHPRKTRDIYVNGELMRTIYTN